MKKIVNETIAVILVTSILLTFLVPYNTVLAAVYASYRDDFTANSYTLGQAPPNPQSLSDYGWYKSLPATSGGALSGAIDSAIITTTSVLPSGRVLENKNNYSLSVYRQLPQNITFNSTNREQYFKFNLYMAENAPTTTNYNIAINFFTDVSTTSSTAWLKIGILADSATGTYRAWAKNGTASYYNASSSTTSTDGKILNRGKIYTFVVKFHSSTSTAVGSQDKISVKAYEYGTAEPETDTITLPEMNSSSVIKFFGFTTSGISAYTPQVSDIQYDAYDGTDIAASNSVFADSALIHPDFSNIQAIGDITPSVSLSAGTTVTWSSTDTSYITGSTIINVIKQPVLPEADKNLFVTATIQNGNASTVKSFPVTIKARGASADEIAVANAKSSLTFDKISSESILGISKNLSLPASDAINGTTFEWSVLPDETCLSSAGVVQRPTIAIGDQTVTLRATVKKGTSQDTKDFTIIVSALPATIAYEDFQYGVGTKLNAVVPAVEKGLGSAWMADSTLTVPLADNVTIQSNSQYGIYTETNTQYYMTTPEPPATPVPVSLATTMYNQLSRPINFDSNKDYYLQWNQQLDPNAATPTSYQKIDFLGASTGLAVALFGKGTSTDYSSLIKIGSNNQNGVLGAGRMYQVLVKISAVSSGSDTIFIKAWPMGEQEPIQWTHQRSAPITGSANKINFQAFQDPEGFVRVGNFQLDEYSYADAQLVNQLSNSLATATVQEAEALSTQINGLSNGLAKTSLTRQLGNFEPLCITGFSFKGADGVYLPKLSTGTVTATVNVKNNQTEAIAGTLIVAVYNGNVLESAKVFTTADGTIKSGESQALSASVEVANAQNRVVKAYIWNHLSRMKPIELPKVLDATGIHQ